MQEDQLYAMEDYISQYQQLVCKYRMENAALRRQLGSGFDAAGGDVLPLPGDAVSPRDERRTPSRGPAFREPETPKPSGGTPSDTPIELPDVPPLEGSTSNNRDADVRTASFISSNDLAGTATNRGTHGEATLVAGNEGTGDQIQSAATAAMDQPQNAQAAPSQVLLRGEVLANDSGGPRLVVDVQRLDPAGGTTKFDGPLSLMLLVRDDNHQPQNLARWDFEADDVHSAAEPSAGEHVMRFYLELPADTPISQATEIWVRLLPRDGIKLLAHTPLNLQQPGKFSSDIVDPPDTPAITVAFPTTTAQENQSVSISQPGTGEWKTARPGQVSNLPSENGSGQWRASSEPMPVVQSAFATAVLPQPVERAAYSEIAPELKSARVFTRPTWSPDRNSLTTRTSKASTTKPEVIARRPIWSADR
jgi:hypothetical protein